MRELRGEGGEMAVTNMHSFITRIFIFILECTCALTMKSCGDYAVNIVEYCFIYASLLYITAVIYMQDVCVCMCVGLKKMGTS